MNLSDPMVSAIIARNKQLISQGVPPEQAMAMMKQSPTTKPIEEVVAQYNALQQAANNAQQQPQPQGTISDQIQMALQQAQQARQMQQDQQLRQIMAQQAQEQGIAALPAENIGSEERYARGGIVAFGVGGPTVSGRTFYGTPEGLTTDPDVGFFRQQALNTQRAASTTGEGLADMFAAPDAEALAGGATEAGAARAGVARVAPLLGRAAGVAGLILQPGNLTSDAQEALNALKVIVDNDGKDAFGRKVPDTKIEELKIRAGLVKPPEKPISGVPAKPPVAQQAPQAKDEDEDEEDSGTAPDWDKLYAALKRSEPKSIADAYREIREALGENEAATEYKNYLAQIEGRAAETAKEQKGQAFNRALMAFGTPKEGQPWLGGIAGLGQAMSNAGMSYQDSISAIQKSQQDLAERIAKDKWEIADAQRRENADDMRTAVSNHTADVNAYRQAGRDLTNLVISYNKDEAANKRAAAVNKRLMDIQAGKLPVQQQAALTKTLTDQLNGYATALKYTGDPEEQKAIMAEMGRIQSMLNELGKVQAQNAGVTLPSGTGGPTTNLASSVAAELAKRGK